MIDKTVSHYKVLGKLGEGGQGVVYRARDLRLDRDVALKFLRESIAGESEFMDRFRREAKVLAALNHPGIAGIYDIDQSDSGHFLTLEYIDGESLAARLKRGPLPPDRTFDLLQEVAAAVAAAHDHGIVHRDLKPANVMLGATGQVKILDFGLARRLPARDPASGPLDVTAALTAVTEAGRVMGTVSYMSPEQARGDQVDARADIWAFGCILYECLTGRRAFGGKTHESTLADVLTAEPAWDALPAGVPTGVRTVLERCLRKDPERRYHSIADVRIELMDAREGEPETAGSAPRPLVPRSLRLPLVLILVVALAAGWFGSRLLTPADDAAPRYRQFTFGLEGDRELAFEYGSPLAISPDGQLLAYVVKEGGNRLLFVRDLRQDAPRMLEGTGKSAQPFFSPDGQWIGFFAAGKLKRVPVDGGTVQSLCDAPSPQGGTWGRAGEIVFVAGSPTAMNVVAEGGGVPLPVPVPPTMPGQAQHTWPSFLPGDREVLTTFQTGFGYEENSIAVVNLETGEHEVLIRNADRQIYSPSGHILFNRTNTIYAVDFVADRREVASTPVIVGAGVGGWNGGGPQYAVANDGTLVMAADPDFVPVWQEQRQVVRVARDGTVTPSPIPAGPYTFPNLSPDGSRLALTIFKESGIENWIWEYDRGLFTRLILDQNAHLPVWSPDGRSLAISAASARSPNVFLMDANAGATTERLTESPSHQDPASWSIDGRYLAVVDMVRADDYDILLLDLQSGGPAQPLVKTSFLETHAMISPAGGWLVFTSNRSGRNEIYLRPFPGSGPLVQVSGSGGTAPMWSRDGTEIYFWEVAAAESGGRLELNRMMVVDVLTTPELRVSRARELLRANWVDHGAGRPNYDVTADGEFIMLQKPRTVVRHIKVILGWS